MDEPMTRLEPWFGHIELRTWIDYDAKRRRWIGMGEIKHYDKDGQLVSCERSPTGIEAYEEDPPLPWWRQLLHRWRAIEHD